jgi:hypothetical protein
MLVNSFILSPEITSNQMKKLILLNFFAFASYFLAHGQNAQSVYFELGGPGIASFNYDTRFSGKDSGFGGRVGIGGISIDGSGVVYFPVGVNWLLGKDGRHYFEVGGGVTPVLQTGEFSDDEEGNLTNTFGHLVFGYRMQPTEGGYTFRAFICPIFGSGFFIPYYAGVSFGYKF